MSSLVVLLVEDHSPLREAMQSYLQTFGIACIACGTIREAVHFIRHGIVHVLATDFVVGRARAQGLIETALSCGIRVIVASAFPVETLAGRFEAGNARLEYLEKPIDLSAFRRLVLAAPPRALPNVAAVAAT